MRSLVISTKGGAGKSTFVFEILAPFMYEKTKSKVKTYEYDSENQETENYFATSLLDSQIIKTNNDEMIGDDLFKHKSEKEFIVDVGGGSRAAEFILSSGSFFNHLFDRIFIPLNCGVQDAVNAIATYKEIVNQGFPAEKITFVLSQADFESAAENKTMFVAFLGSNEMPKAKSGFGFDGYLKQELGKKVDYLFAPYNQRLFWSKLQGKLAYELHDDLPKFQELLKSNKDEEIMAGQKNVRIITEIDRWVDRMKKLTFPALEKIYV